VIITYNVVADTLTGNPGSTIVVGSHLDSVDAGPGINDNGSGSATNLELALQIATTSLPLENRVRFCWFAAEELGLIGSTVYVGNLSSAEKAEIALMLNFDMLGSPNYFRGIYDGASAANATVRPGSAAIQSLFENYFNAQSLSWDLTAFDGRSDYGPFIANGIPAGGLFTGAEGTKNISLRTKYGGLANAAFDPCYHQACDTVDNINQEVLSQMAKAAANTLQIVAQMTDVREWLNTFNPSPYMDSSSNVQREQQPGPGLNYAK